MRLEADALSEAWFGGAVSLESSAGSVRPWRLPVARRAFFEPELILKAGWPSGVRLRGITDAAELAIEVAPEAEPRTFDLVIGHERRATKPLPAGASTLGFERLPGRDEPFEIWFPVDVPVAVRSISTPGDTLRPAGDERPRWIAYGSSITHCRQAHSPSRTWPAIAARACRLNLCSLGYGGQCLLDPEVARMIRDLPAELISMKLGINTYACMNDRVFRALAMGLFRTVREGHPTTPMVVLGPILAPARETTPSPTGQSLNGMRAALAGVVDRLRAAGDGSIVYRDGRCLFDTGDLDHLPDGVHPDGDGIERMGRRFAEVVLAAHGFPPKASAFRS